MFGTIFRRVRKKANGATLLPVDRFLRNLVFEFRKSENLSLKFKFH
jgi:hypothetical protein